MILEKRALEHQLEILDSTLKHKQSLYQRQILRHSELLNKLNLELPAKERQRIDRALARETREKASSTDDPALIQLSQKIVFRYSNQFLQLLLNCKSDTANYSTKQAIRTI
ncbi:MAG: hypothetical protein ACRCXC_13630 [Legionella sp.]